MKLIYSILIVLILISCSESVKEYYPSGALKFEYKLNEHGQLIGNYHVYYENGQPMAIIPFSEGIRNGVATYYDSTGYVCDEETYIDGLVKKYKSINNKGQVTYAFTNLDSLDLPSMDDFKITFSHRQDTFTVGDTTMIDIACDKVSKNNIRLLISYGATQMNWLRDNYIYNYTPKDTGKSTLSIFIQMTDSIPELHRIGSKEYTITN